MNTFKHSTTYCLMGLLAILLAVPAQAQQLDDPSVILPNAVTPDGKGNITFTPGVRMQVRYEYIDAEGNNDFFIRRMRFKGKGKIFDIASYNFELKVDNTGRFNRAPLMQLEHAWFTFPVVDEVFTIRVGLEDDVFSRNALTSDSKLLLMDRSLIKNALTVLGITDNTVGLLAYGRPLDGHLTYSAGVFDNLGFNVAGIDTLTPARKADGTMFVGRMAYDFLDPANPKGSYDDYRASYIGEGQRLTLGANAAYESKVEIGSEDFSLFAYGIDLFFNTGPVSLEGEYNAYSEKAMNSGKVDINGSGWYAQTGILFLPKWELAFRYQELDLDENIPDDKLQWTSIGLNYYLRGHDFKLQTDYTFKKEEGEEINNDVFQLQLQLSF